MNNPWLKKNPFLSMWLTGANTMFGYARGVMGAQMQRQGRAVAAEMTKAIVASPQAVAGKPRRAAKKRTRR